MKAFEQSLGAAGLLWLWTSFAAVASLFVLASVPSGIPLSAPPMSFADFIGQVNWQGMFADGETLVVPVILVGAATLVGAYSMTKAVLGRLGLAVIGALAPAVALTDSASEFLSWSVEMPSRAGVWTLQALTGRGDGQFYGDGPFVLAAIGWWTVFCLVLVFRESLLLFRTRWAAARPGSLGMMTTGSRHILAILLLCFGLRTGAAQPGVTSRGTSGPDVSSAVESVLKERGFRLPVSLLGTNADTWLTCDRFEDRWRFDRVLVCIGRNDEVTVQIIPYRFGPSDWAVPRGTEFYQGDSGHKDSQALLASRLWLPGPVQGFGIFPWHLRGTNQVKAAGAEGLRERAFKLVGYALAEESVETEKGAWVQVSGCRYVGDPVSPEGREATTLGRAIQERLRKRSSAAEGEK